jgi:hypothetical protein
MGEELPCVKAGSGGFQRIVMKLFVDHLSVGVNLVGTNNFLSLVCEKDLVYEDLLFLEECNGVDGGWSVLRSSRLLSPCVSATAFVSRFHVLNWWSCLSDE